MSHAARGFKQALPGSASAIGALIGLFSAGPAWAATAADAATTDASGAATVESVVVTAERRSANIEKTPVAITAVAAPELDKAFINDLSSLNAEVPGLEVTKTSGQENLVTIRGVGSETPSNSITTSPGVSLFVDGVFISNTLSLDQTLFDIDRIEVLRGPQGDLYGESSIGGAINIITKQPQLGVFGGTADFSFGTYDLSRERLAVNIPIGDTLAVRLSLQKYDHTGFTKDVYFPDFREDDAHDGSVKLAVLWKPSDKFSATLSGEYYKADENGPAQKNITDTEPSAWEVYQDFPGHFKLSTQFIHLNMQLDEPGFSVRSITGYQGLFNDYTMDVTRSAYSVLGLYEDLVEWNKTLKTYTEELDVLSPPGSKLEWIAGAFVFNQSAQAPTLEYEGSSPDPDTDPGILAIPPNVIGAPPSNLSYGNVTTVTRQGDGAFARLTWHATPKLRITLGARFNWDRYSDDSHNFSAYGASVVSHVYTDTVPTGRIEADYDVTADNMLYASASRGYKPGGLNGNNGQALVPDGFKAEINTALEVGAKNYFLDRTLTLNMAGYYYFYRDFQYIEYDPVPFDSGITNIPDIQEYGFEAEAAYHAPDGHLRLDGTLGLEHGQVVGKDLSVDSTIGQSIEGNPNGPCANGGEYYSQACWNQVIASAKNVQGNTPPAMPNVTASVTAAYRFDIPFGALTPRAQFIYRGHEWARIFNEPTLDSVKGYGVTNLYLEFAPTASRFRVSVAATNVFNVDGVNSRLTDPYGVYSTSEQFIPPRQVIASVAYSW